MGIHMLMGYCPFYGYNLASRLIEGNIVETCDIAGWRKRFGNETDKIKFYYSYDQKYCDYSHYANINDLPALSKQLLEEMLPYESMCLKLGRRRSNYPIVEYESEKMNYHNHLRFWNWVFDNRGINFVYFDEFPHNLASDYIIYSLAKIKKIPILMSDYPSGLGIRLYADDFDKFGYDIKQYFEDLPSDCVIDDDMITGIIGDFYRKILSKANDKNLVLDKTYVKKIRRETEKVYFSRYIGAKGYLRFIYNKLRLLHSTIMGEAVDKSMYYFDIDYQRQLFYKRRFAVKMEKYDQLAEMPIEGERYILFCMQMTPEATTLPLAGVFSEQYSSIILIARAAEKNGLKLYVKDHFVQAYRDKHFYEMISDIPNVRLIKSYISSNYLLRKAVAVSTQTGTIILEGALNGVPALVTSSGYAWKGLPGVYEILDENQGVKIVGSIMNSYSPDINEIKKYFYSISQVAYDDPVPENWEEARTMIEPVNKRAQIINNFIKGNPLLQ